MTSKCWKCDAPGTHIPKLVMRAFSGASPAEMFFDLPTCLKHAPKPSELITDRTWAGIVEACVTSKKLAPRRDLNVVVLVRARSQDAIAFYRLVKIGRGSRIATEPVH